MVRPMAAAKCDAALSGKKEGRGEQERTNLSLPFLPWIPPKPWFWLGPDGSRRAKRRVTHFTFVRRHSFPQQRSHCLGGSPANTWKITDQAMSRSRTSLPD